MAKRIPLRYRGSLRLIIASENQMKVRENYCSLYLTIILVQLLIKTITIKNIRKSQKETNPLCILIFLISTNKTDFFDGRMT